MSSSRDHSSLTGVPGICLAISDRLADIVGLAAAAEAAAEDQLVDVAFVGRQAGGFQRRGEAPPRRSASPHQTSHLSAV